MKKNRQTREEGMALIVATLFVSVALIALGVLTMRMVNESQQVDSYIHQENCMYGISNGLAQSIAKITGGGQGTLGFGDGMTTDGTDESLYDVDFTRELAYLEENELIGEDVDIDLSSAVPVSVPGMPELKYLTIDIDWGNDNIDNDGDGDTDEDDEQFQHTIYALGGNNGQERMVEVVVAGRDVSVWNNAVFAGGGAAGGAINGNVNIDGSMHILGDNIPEGGDAIVVVDMSGTCFVHNYYSGKVDHMIDMVPELEKTTVNGETGQYTLNAEVRVKKGRISLDGNSEIGAVDQAGNGVKEQMDGTFNNDGWSGNSTVDDGGRGIPGQVFSDNGYVELYDLGDQVKFPVMEDPWQWPTENDDCTNLGYDYPVDLGQKEVPDPSVGTPAEYLDEDGYYTHEGYYSEVLSKGDPYVPEGGTVTFNPELTGSTTTSHGVTTTISSTKVYINITRPTDDDPTHRLKDGWDGACGKGDDYLFYDPDTQVLEINGQIVIEGDLQMLGGSGEEIYVNGSGSILLKGSALLDTNLYTCNNNPGTGEPDISRTNLSFPNNCFGLMATGDITMGGSAQIDLMGAFYSAGTITSAKQTIVMGTYVANFFNMGKNVPEIHQVPSLAQSLPLGMLGATPILNLQTVSWRELNVAVAPATEDGGGGGTDGING